MWRTSIRGRRSTVAVKGDIDPETLTDTRADRRHRAAFGLRREASHSDGILSFVMRDRPRLDLAGVPPRHGDADRPARARSSPHQGLLNLAGSKGPVVFQACST